MAILSYSTCSSICSRKFGDIGTQPNTSLCEKCLWSHLWHRAAMCSTEMLFSNFVQCMGPARSSCLLPLSIAFLRKRLPRAPHLGRFGHAAVYLELLMERSQLPSNLRGFPFPLCPDFSEKGNEDLLVPYSTSPSDAGAAHRGKRVTLEVSCVQKGNWLYVPSRRGRRQSGAEVPASPGPAHLPPPGTEPEGRMPRGKLKHFCVKSATAGL